jgi:hypothetical protein
MDAKSTGLVEKTYTSKYISQERKEKENLPVCLGLVPLPSPITTETVVNMKEFLLLLIIGMLLPFCHAAEGASKCKAKRGHTATYDKKKKRCVYKKAPRSKWKIKSSRDSFTGEIFLYAYLPAEGTITGAGGRYTPELYVRCKEGELDIYVYFGLTMSCSSEIYSMRFDNYAIFDMYVTPASDCSTMFWYDSDFSNHDFLFAMQETNKLRVKADVYLTGYQTVNFALAGAREVYKRMLAVCPEPPPEDEDDGNDEE